MCQITDISACSRTLTRKQGLRSDEAHLTGHKRLAGKPGRCGRSAFRKKQKTAAPKWPTSREAELRRLLLEEDDEEVNTEDEQEEEEEEEEDEKEEDDEEQGGLKQNKYYLHRCAMIKKHAGYYGL